MSVPSTNHSSGQLRCGDALAVLQTMPSDSVDQVITSPPYFRLRHYEADAQIGLEAHIDEWVASLRKVFTECARVLTPTGTLWLNVADTYSTHAREGASRKSLLLGPERLIVGLQADGWIVRNRIVWVKPSTTPSSVRDRFSTKHETIFVLARQPNYFFDLDAVREPHTSRPPSPRRTPAVKTPARPAWLGPNSDSDSGLVRMHAAGITGHPLGKNPGDVWRIGVSRYRGGHFATFPEALAERMVLAGCPEQRCTSCRLPHVRPLKRDGQQATRLSLAPTCDCGATSEPGLVLDPFMGAGTTAVVAEQLGRSWFGIDISQRYIELARERVRRAADVRGAAA